MNGSTARMHQVAHRKRSPIVRAVKKIVGAGAGSAAFSGAIDAGTFGFRALKLRRLPPWRLVKKVAGRNMAVWGALGSGIAAAPYISRLIRRARARPRR